jgi:aminopeptidase N
MRHYLDVNGGTSVDTDAFRHAMEQATGAGLDGFFDQWVERAGVPSLHVTWEWLDQRRLAHIVVEQTQPSDSLTPVFRFDLPLRFALASGDLRGSLRVDGRHQETYVTLPSRPRYVEVNDDLSVLCRLSFERPAPELAAQLADAPLGASRIEAARALADMAGRPAALAALARALKEDRFWAVRRAAANALGAVPTASGLAGLEPGLHDPDARVRKVAVAALAHFRETSGAAAAARAALADPAYGVAAAGLGALAQLGADDAFAQCEKALARASWNDTLRTAALDALAELADPRGFAIMVARTHPREPLTVRIAAARALGKLGAKLPAEPAAGKTTRRDARLAIEPLLWDDHVRLRQEASSALGTLGDPDALPALARALAREPEDLGASSVLDAQKKLGAKGDHPAGELRNEIDRLKDRNRALESRVQALEDALKK